MNARDKDDHTQRPVETIEVLGQLWGLLSFLKSPALPHSIRIVVYQREEKSPRFAVVMLSMQTCSHPNLDLAPSIKQLVKNLRASLRGAGATSLEASTQYF
jgi:hypothetical protein